MKIIEVNEGEIKVVVKSMHLPRDSGLVSPHHQLLAQLGLYRKNRLSPNKKKAFSVTFAMDNKSRKKIEEEFNIFIAKVREISIAGKKSDIYQLNFDLFPWSSPE